MGALAQFMAGLAEALQRDQCWGLVLHEPCSRPSGGSSAHTDKISVRPVEIAGRRCSSWPNVAGSRSFIATSIWTTCSGL